MGGRLCPPILDTHCRFEHHNSFCCAASSSKACPGHCNALGISSALGIPIPHQHILWEFPLRSPSPQPRDTPASKKVLERALDLC